MVTSVIESSLTPQDNLNEILEYIIAHPDQVSTLILTNVHSKDNMLVIKMEHTSPLEK